MGSTHQQDRVCLVMGAASWVGVACAEQLRAEGATVVSCDVWEPVRASAPDEDGAKDLRIFLRMDVTAQQDIHDAVSTILDRYVRIDVLANVVAIMDGHLTVHKIDGPTWAAVMGVSLEGPFRLSRAVLPSMLAQGGGSIVNAASIATVRWNVGSRLHHLQAALIGLTRSVAWTYGYENIRCNAVLPGGTNTGTLSKLQPQRALGYRRARPVLKTGIRMAEPSEIAAAVCWLASAEASFVNGALMTANGGCLPVRGVPAMSGKVARTTDDSFDQAQSLSMFYVLRAGQVMRGPTSKGGRGTGHRELLAPEQ